MQKGKNIKVFLSSTFKDMDAERDLIMNRVAPLLQERFLQKASLSSLSICDGVSTHRILMKTSVKTLCYVSALRKSVSLVLSLLDYWGVAMDGSLLMTVGR